MGTFRKWLPRTFLCFLYFCAGLQFIRFYTRSTTFYIHLQPYLAGHERMPFQERVLPILFIKPMLASKTVMHLLTHDQGVSIGLQGPFYVLSLIGFAAAAICVQLLYRAIRPRGTLAWLVFPIFLFTVMWTYTIHLEANYSYPYDMLSLAFFTAGLLFIYKRQFLPLLAVMLIGTWNRETTLFLIGIFAIDAMSTTANDNAPVLDRMNFRLFPWGRVAILGAVWLGIKLWLAHHFHGNDESENYVRIAENAGRLKLRLVPALLNICGYLFPLVILLWRRISPPRFGNYVWIALPWMLIMFYTGVILETRIYGELCSYTAVALVLIAESRFPVFQKQQHHTEAHEAQTAYAS